MHARSGIRNAPTLNRPVRPAGNLRPIPREHRVFEIYNPLMRAAARDSAAGIYGRVARLNNTAIRRIYKTERRRGGARREGRKGGNRSFNFIADRDARKTWTARSTLWKNFAGSLARYRAHLPVLRIDIDELLIMLLGNDEGASAEVSAPSLRVRLHTRYMIFANSDRLLIGDC